MSKRKQISVKEITPETSDAKTFTLERLTGEKTDYKPGQFLTIIFETPSGEFRRNYSISSSPVAEEALQITIKRIANGLFSRKMVDLVKPGDILTTIGANGFFTLPDNLLSVEQLFLLAAGSGITPVYSILKTVLYRYPKIKVTLIYSNRSR